MTRSSKVLAGERGAALPLVILMVVLIALALSATAILTQSSATTVRTQAVESGKRAALVTGALQSALRELTPASGRLLGVDPRVDPAGSCVGQLSSYTDSTTQVAVDCVQVAYSGLGSALSSLLLVGDGSDCGSSCVAGQDGGLRVNSNSALTFQGILINAAGAWDAKKVTLNPDSPTISSVLQPDPASVCPAISRSFAFSFNNSGFSAKCDCPSGMDASHCYKRTSGDLQSDIAMYIQRIGQTLATSTPGDAAQIPSCADAARFAGSTGPWVIRLTGGTIGATELAALNLLTGGSKPCIGDGSTKSAPALVVSGVLQFTGTTPGSTRGTTNTWAINSASAVIVAGTPKYDTTTSAVTDCDAAQSGVMLQFAGSSYVQLQAGRMFLCAAAPGGVVLAAPTTGAGAGFVWQGDRTSPLLETQFGSSGGEQLKVHGMLFSPAAYFNINSQDKSTLVRLDGGSILRALSLSGNPSTSSLAQGSFYAPQPTVGGQREVQLRFWDTTRGRDLGMVDVVITDTYPNKPATAYAFKVWRTMW